MKIVFFMESTQVGGGMLTLLNLAKYLADNTDNEVYYLNYQNDEACQTFYSSKINFCRLETVDFEQFSNAVFIVPINYFFLFLRHTKVIPNARILLYVWHPDAVEWLADKTYKKIFDIHVILQMLKEHNSVAFMDESCRYAVLQKYGVEFPQQYLPVAVSRVPEFTMPRDHNTKKEINIGWLGRLDRDKIYSILNAISNIQNSSITQNVIFHIIGNGNSEKILDHITWNNKVRIVRHPAMYGQERDNFIRDNIDLMIAMGLSALESCYIGVPTVIAPLETKINSDSNQYVFLHDTSDYCLGWDQTVLTALHYPTYTIEQIIEMISDVNTRRDLSVASRRFADQHFDLSVSARDFLMPMLDRSTLTAANAFNCKSIKKHFRLYHLYRLVRRKRDYAAYMQFCIKLNNQTPEKHKFFYLFKLSLKNFAKKHRNHPIMKTLWTSYENLKQHRRRRVFMKVQKSYALKAQNIHNDIIAKQRKVRVAFFVIFESTFQYGNLFKRMCTEPGFDPKIVIIPDHQRGVTFMETTYRAAHTFFQNCYPGFVVHGYDFSTQTNVVFDNSFDIVFFSNPYASMVCSQHKVEYFTNQNVLTFFSNYSYEVVNYWKNIVVQDFCNYLTAFFLETEMHAEFLKKVQCIRGVNGVVVGYPKMDRMQLIKSKTRTNRKKIIIAPHHTVRPVGGLLLSNFLKYKDLFLELPRLYPQIDFVFRPHPLLFANLLDNSLWTREQIDTYLETLLQNENVIYSTEGNYFELFEESDGMIHDCGSYTAEYLYTEKPCCFLMRNPYQVETTFLPVGRDCLKQHYISYCTEDIFQFIEKVILQGDDPLKEQRELFSRTVLKKHYPDSSKMIMSYIAKLLQLDKGQETDILTA